MTQTYSCSIRAEREAFFSLERKSLLGFSPGQFGGIQVRSQALAPRALCLLRIGLKQWALMLRARRESSGRGPQQPLAVLNFPIAIGP
jgi:hypothetical protein